MLRRTRISLDGKRRQFPTLRHSDHSRYISSYHIRTSPSWTFPLLPRTFSFSLAPIWMRYRSIWGRNMTFTSRNRSEEHTSELQSHLNLVCRLLLEKKTTHKRLHHNYPLD